MAAPLSTPIAPAAPGTTGPQAVGGAIPKAALETHAFTELLNSGLLNRETLVNYMRKLDAANPDQISRDAAMRSGVSEAYRGVVALKHEIMDKSVFGQTTVLPVNVAARAQETHRQAFGQQYDHAQRPAVQTFAAARTDTGRVL